MDDGDGVAIPPISEPISEPITVRVSTGDGFDPALGSLETFVSTAPEFFGGGEGVQEPSFNGEANVGVDLRDLGMAGPGTVMLSQLLRALTTSVARRVGEWFAVNVARGAVALYSRLPGWVQEVVSSAFAPGTDVMHDVPVSPGLGAPDGPMDGPLVPVVPHQVPHLVDGHVGGHIIGTWIANGVTFYRFSDGKLGVQNKMGKWKIWRPKKPIVIMPSGAKNLRTLIRADRVLNRQAKQLAAMLNRRAPRTRRTPSATLMPAHGHKPHSLEP